MHIFLPKTEGHKHYSGRHSHEIQFFTENVCLPWEMTENTDENIVQMIVVGT